MHTATAGARKHSIAQEPQPIYSNVKHGLYGLWVFALFWNALVWPVLLGLREVLLARYVDGDYVMLLVLIAPIIGLVSLSVAFARWWRWRRFGTTPLFLNPFPGSIGGHVAGKIRLPDNVPTQVRYDVSLVCVYTYETKNAQNRGSSAERMLWQNSMTGELRRGIDGMDVLFCFDVPEGLARSEAVSGNYHHWRLHIHAEGNGDDLDRYYDVPVHPTCISTSLDLSAGRRGSAANLHKKLMGQMRVETVPGLLHMFFPPGRQRWLGGLLCMTGLLLLAVSFLLLRIASDSGAGLPATASGLAMLFASTPCFLFGIYVPFRSLDVKIASDAIASNRAVLGISVYKKRVGIATVHSVAITRYRWANWLPWRRESFRVIANIADGGRVVLAEELHGQDVAEEALRFIRANGNLVV